MTEVPDFGSGSSASGARCSVNPSAPRTTATCASALRRSCVSASSKLGFPEVGTKSYPGLSKFALKVVPPAVMALGAIIVTNKPGWLTGPLLEHFALHRRAKVIVSGDTLAQRKPHPAPLLHAAAGLAAAPAECIYIGDAERDVLAAKAAGMHVYVALFGYIPANEQPRDWPASGWLDSPQAMARLLGSIAPRG